jgi:hypothetical protein
MEELFGPVIHSYTRAQAIEDGQLVDVTTVAKEAGFTLPTVVTRHVWEDCVAWSDDEEYPQDESGRLWDVVFMARAAAGRSRDTDLVKYMLNVVPRGTKANAAFAARPVSLWLHIGPGDAGEPVLTIMFPEDY